MKKDDPFFYERSNTMIAEINKVQESSLNKRPSNNPDKGEIQSKSIAKPSQFRGKISTHSSNQPLNGNFSYKTKTKKRPKFTMRNDKIVASKMQIRKNKNHDLNFRV